MDLRWMHRVRLYPTKSQRARLNDLLGQTRTLYNAALQERKDAWRMRRIEVTQRQQSAELTALRAENPRLRSCYRELQDAVLHRLHVGYCSAFARIKRKQIAGFPRYKSANRWKQLEFQHGDRALKLDARQRKVRIPGVGTVPLRKGREIPAFGRAFLVESNGRWYAVFEGWREPEPLPPTGKAVGIDRGIRVLAAFSDGTPSIANPKHVERRQALVERHQRDLERVTERDAARRVRNRHDPKRKAVVRRLARAKERERNARRDALHKLSRKLVQTYDTIVVEKLQIRNMVRAVEGTVEAPGRNVRAKARLNRSIADAGWGTLVTLLREKGEWTAREIVEVPAKDTSRTCAVCAHVAAESRVGPRFRCVGCGHEDDADVNAAKVILHRAQLSARAK